MASPHKVDFTGGVAPEDAYGQENTFTYGGTWAIGDTWTINVVTDNQGDFTLGYGNISVRNYRCALGLLNRIYLGFGSQFNFSAIDDPTGWEEQNVGAGFVPYTTNYGALDTVNAFASYQGLLAVCGRYSVQIWTPDADPTLFSLKQTLINIGTFASLSVGSLGDLDVILLYDSGIRSIRVRDASLNAYTEDLGIAIDLAVQQKLATMTETEKAACCSVIDPTANRYWLFMKDVIYVLSYFPASKITGWTTYLPTYQASGVTTTFTPQKFVVHGGKVYVRTANAIFSYGGSDGNTYDATVSTLQTPYQSGAGKVDQPATDKRAIGLNAVFTGTWTLSGNMDWQGGVFKEVAASISNSTVDKGYLPYDDYGSHFAVKLVSSGTGRKTVSQIMFHYELGDNQAT